MTLHAYGCSLTYGQALVDCHGENSGPGPNPSKFAWPQLLADQLGIDCMNHSMPGGSNKYIIHKLTQTQIDPNDIVVIQWSYLARWVFFGDEEQHEGPWKSPHSNFYKTVWNAEDCKFNNRILIDYAWLHLKDKGCRFVFASVEKGQKAFWVDEDLEYIFDDVDFRSAKFDYKSIKDFQLDLALDNRHPGPQSHKKYAEYLAKLPILAG
jgi:hypothetical protein